jgi:hypothetical protein
VGYPILVGGVEGLLAFPQLARGSFGWPRLIAPPLIKLGGEADRSSGRGRSSDWGSTFLDRFDEEGHVHISRVGMRFHLLPGEGKAARQVAADLFGAIGPWSERLSNWLDVLSGRKPTEPVSWTWPRAKPPDELHGLELLHVDQTGERTRQRPPPQPTTLQFQEVIKVAEDAWLAILGHVSDGTAPPTERLLLRDALLAFDQRQLRRSVLDAATAAELALTRMLDDRLRGMPRKDADKVRRQAQGLARLGQNLHRLGVEPPSQLQDILGNIRNKAIHAGGEPTLQQARDAILLARTLVDQAQPFRRILDLQGA